MRRTGPAGKQEFGVEMHRLLGPGPGVTVSVGGSAPPPHRPHRGDGRRWFAFGLRATGSPRKQPASLLSARTARGELMPESPVPEAAPEAVG